VKVITFTKVNLPNGWMGNMSAHPIETRGNDHELLLWRTAEAAFQAFRFDKDDPVREEIRLQTSPMAAKMIAKREKERMVITPQSEADLFLMKDILLLKLDTHPGLKVLLKETEDATIIEDVTKRPHGSGMFWGAALQSDGTWLGENHLGKMWMDIRSKCK
jgi:predicted NAD-dependent protein-ADP-ribosyltransferase YbiA (DUF1768 family)